MQQIFHHNGFSLYSDTNVPRADNEFALFNFSNDSLPDSPVSPQTLRTYRTSRTSSSYIAQSEYRDPANTFVRIPFMPSLNSSEEDITCFSPASQRCKASSESKEGVKAVNDVISGEGVPSTPQAKPVRDKEKSRAAKMWNKLAGRGPKVVI